MENVVAVELARQGRHNLRYFRNCREIDFVLPNREGLQVTYSVQDREVEGLLAYMKVSKTKRGYIITWDEEEHIKKGNFEIRAVPLYKFLLERFL